MLYEVITSRLTKWSKIKFQRSSVAQLSTQLNLPPYYESTKEWNGGGMDAKRPSAAAATAQPPECVELKGLSPGQKRICELFKDHMHAVGSGAKQAIFECEWQFRNNRWNCSTPQELKGHIGPIHKKGTREAAFTYAILSAGVTHEIGRRCRQGHLRSCGCSGSENSPNRNLQQQNGGVNEDWTWSGCGDNIDYGYRFSRDFIDVREKEENTKRSAEWLGRSLMNRWNNEVGRKQQNGGVNEDWTWSGCGDNIDYGYRFSRDFIDVREKEENTKRSAEWLGRSLMNRWNNEVGRKIVKRHTKPKCKCHGVSGSCNLKTCWMQLPPIRQIGNILQAKYRQAKRIQINSRGNMQFDEPLAMLDASTSTRHQRQQQQRRKNRALTDLVFLDISPDYCRIDRTDGTIGTQGRVCSNDPHASNSCDLLCCGRGFESHIEETVSKCNCKFQWCCHVVCETCRNPPIRQIGNILQAKYRQAKRIQINSRGNMQFDEPLAMLDASTATRHQRQQQQRRKNRALTDLVFLDISPDYCRIDRTDGTIGTQGRVCSNDPHASNSCDLLCCGRGFESHIEETVSKCNCKFQWCCHVVCETCRNVTQVFTCK
uniref:Protein Wnt n=1 Tax=Globodera pallida TaxID=36090 RepID=A0A183BYV5_GLOPA